ncbi:MAG: hypothetical protein ACRC5M_06440 [Anaeroplasmataceae bacterium]
MSIKMTKIGLLEKQDMIDRIKKHMIKSISPTQRLSMIVGSTMSIGDLYIAKLYWSSVGAMARSVKHKGKNRKTTSHRNNEMELNYGIPKRVNTMLDKAIIIAKEFKSIDDTNDELKYVRSILKKKSLPEIKRFHLERKEASLLGIQRMYSDIKKPDMDSLELTDDDKDLLRILRKSVRRKK